MPIDDEMPQAPGTNGAAADAVSINGEFDMAALDGVPNLGDALPAGVYEVRLRSFSEKKNDNGPFFGLQWSVQQEPHAGRLIFENYVPFCTPEQFAAAVAGDPVAKAAVADRMPRLKSIMKAADYKPVGKTDIKAFLATNPELKIQINVKEKKQKVEATGKYEGTGEMENGVVKYISKQAPR